MWATIPCATTACCSSLSDQRASGTPPRGQLTRQGFDGDDDSGGKAGRPPAPRQLLEAWHYEPDPLELQKLG